MSGPERSGLHAAPRHWLVQESDLRRVTRNALPVHVHAMPAIQVNRLMVRMAHTSASVNLGIAGHAAPSHLRRVVISGHEPLVTLETHAHRVLPANHDGDTLHPHQLFTDMRLASGPA